MKKLLSIVLLLAFIKPGSAQQLQLSGSIKGIAAGDSVEVNVPFDGDYYADNSTCIKPDSKQQFKFNLPGKAPGFVQLRYKDARRILLLIPRKPLVVNFDAADMVKTITVAGEAKIVNELLLRSALNTYSLSVNNLYDNRKWSADSLINIMLAAVKRELDTALKVIGEAAIPAKTKDILSTELKYYYANKLLKFSAGIRDKMSREKPWAKLMDTVVHSFTLPGSNELAISPAASTYIHLYMGYQFYQLGFSINENKESKENIIKKATGMPYDTVMNRAYKYGEDYLLTLLSKKYLPGEMRERLLANMTLKYADMKDLRYATQLMQDLVASFPKSIYLAICKKKINRLEKLMIKNGKNKDIVFVPDSIKIASLKDLIAPYKGKLVYMDIWGTWCGPCVTEIVQYSAALKSRFKNNKDIIFLYLEMDHSRVGDEVKWKEFVNMHNVVGYHVRVDEKTMENIWIELLQTRDAPRYFPTYVIFDRDGNVIDKNAKRPSAGEFLYKDLELAISK